MKKTVLGILELFLLCMLTFSFNIRPVRSSGTIYIRADGSIDPLTVPISSIDNVTYTLKGNINDSIVVERNKIVIDGAGYTVVRTQWAWESIGIDLTGRSNVTIKNINITNFHYGIYLYESSNNIVSGSSIVGNNRGINIYSSFDASISGNNITNSQYGIYLTNSSHNSIIENGIADNDEGIVLNRGSLNNLLSSNNIRANYMYGGGILLVDSLNNSVVGNNITNGWYGIWLVTSSRNTISGNLMNCNEYGFDVQGYILSHFMQFIDVSNLIDGKPVYYLVNQKDLTVNPTTHSNVGYLALVNCTRITIQNLNLTNKQKGLLFVSTTNSTVSENNISNNWDGVYLYDSANNVFTGNIIERNRGNFGISVALSDDTTIAENRIAYNLYGITLSRGSSNNRLVNNNITSDSYGIGLWESSKNTLTNNKITNNECGIQLVSSPNNKLRNNIMINNHYSFGVYSNVYPSPLEHFVNDVDTSNTVDGKPIYYWINRQGGTIPSDAGYVALVNSVGITVRNLNLTRNLQGTLLAHTRDSIIQSINATNNNIGIALAQSSRTMIIGNNIMKNEYAGINLDYSSDSTIMSNNITNNGWNGLELYGSSNNSIIGNNITNNSQLSSSNGIALEPFSNYNSISGNNITNNSRGIYIRYTSNNRFWHNNLVGNTQQVFIDAPVYERANVWDDGYPSGGNFWSDHAGVDLKSGPNQDLPGSDGIEDTPYIIDADNRDRYPLMIYGKQSEHELNTLVVAPAFLRVGDSSSLEATVTNLGSNDEVDVELRIFVNGTEVSSRIIPLLRAGDSYTLNYVWTAVVEGNYNLTACTLPVPGEVSVENNQRTVFMKVVQVGVKAGDRIKYDYTITGWPSDSPYPERLTVEFLGVEGTTATIRVAIRMSDGTSQCETIIIDVVAGGEAFGLSGFVVPANLTTGDSIYMTGYGDIMIVSETTGVYAGENRTVVCASVLQYGIQLIYYWDKQTGVMVESSAASANMNATGKATATNLWGFASMGDLNNDGRIDIQDIAEAAKAFASHPDHPRWNPIADLNGDWKVDIFDMVKIARSF